MKQGACTPEHLTNVKALGATMQVASKCGLGQTSPSAFLCIIEHFGDEIAAARGARVTEGVSMSNPTTPIHRAPLSQQHRRVLTTTSPDAIGALVTVTIDGIEAKVPFGTTILQAAETRRHPHPDPVPPPRPRRGRRVPHLRGRGRGPAHAAAGLHLPGHQPDEHQHPQPQGAAGAPPRARAAAQRALRRVLQLRAQRQLRAAVAGRGVRHHRVRLRTPGRVRSPSPTSRATP